MNITLSPAPMGSKLQQLRHFPGSATSSISRFINQAMSGQDAR